MEIEAEIKVGKKTNGKCRADDRNLQKLWKAKENEGDYINIQCDDNE